MQNISLKDRLDRTAALLKANALELGVEVGPEYAVDGDSAYVACWPVRPAQHIDDVNACVGLILSLCTRLGNAKMSACVRYGSDAVCCGTVTITDHGPENPHSVVVVVLPTERVAQARHGLDISRTIIPLADVPELMAA